jgi:hypothetical protein
MSSTKVAWLSAPMSSSSSGAAQLGFDFGDLFGGVGVAVALEGDHVAAFAVEDAAEVAPAADGPVHRVGGNSQDVFDLFHQIEGVAGFAVEFVDEGEDGDVAQGAHLEQLDGLGLDALGAVDDHDHRVGRHERAVGVFRKVLVAGGVKDVDAFALVGELQHRRGDRNAAFGLDVHPVGHGVLRGALALHGAGGLDAARVEQELFGQGRFAGVGVRDDRERAARGDLIRQA